ncbi:MAG: folate-binding protein YgfZ [Myxococcota bacterium]
MSRADAVAAVRQGVGLFPMDSRGLIEVRGGDRERWLDGMISGDVSALSKGPEGAGCYATLLTNRGAIVADLHVGKLRDSFWIESAAGQIANIKEALERFIIADDVELVDRSAEFSAWGIEGPCASVLLERFLGEGADSALPGADQWCETSFERLGVSAMIAGFGFSGESAFQVRVPASSGEALGEALAGTARDAVEAGLLPGFGLGDDAALEVLRVEAGIPDLESELLGVLPPEARLEDAIATDKGCYVGQEIVARLRSRGQVNHLLVGLRLSESASLPEAGVELKAGDRKTGRVTSAVVSPTEGAIALGFVRREHAEAGARVVLGSGDGHEAVVAELPLVAGLARTVSEQSEKSDDGPDVSSGQKPA